MELKKLFGKLFAKEQRIYPSMKEIDDGYKCDLIYWLNKKGGSWDISKYKITTFIKGEENEMMIMRISIGRRGILLKCKDIKDECRPFICGVESTQMDTSLGHANVFKDLLECNAFSY